MRRLLKIYHGINSSTPTEIIRLSYDEVGRLQQKKIMPNGTYVYGGIPDFIYRPPSPNVGIDDIAKKAICLQPGTEITNTYSATIDPNGTTGTPINGLQTINYSWHIRGGLRGINLDGSGNPTPNASQGDLFSFKLDYETASQWDGNIGKQTWSSAPPSGAGGALRSYTYSYDAAKRLTAAAYTGVNGEDFSLPQITYDKNGNIGTLQRKGSLGGSYGFIDNLTYHYGSSGNRLQGVTDATGSLEGFKEAPTGGLGAYTYWADGSLKSDANKGISLIEYDTFLKRVKQVTWADGKWLKFFYDGSGKLLKRQNSAGDVWEYVGGMILKNGQPYQLTTPEGRAVYASGAWNYEFEYRDVWNNLRVSFAADGNQLVSKQASDYDAFGYEFNKTATVPINYFKYQKQERIEDFGLGVDMFKYRPSDFIIGRFWQIDPLAEKFVYNSPYALQENKFGLGVELEGKELKAFNDFMAGVSAALVDNSVILPTNYRSNRAVGKDPDAFKAGETVGDLLSIVQGGSEILAGGSEAVVTTLGGVTAPAAVVGGAIAVHGGAVIGKATANLTSRTYDSQNNSSQTGTRFTPKEKQKVVDANKQKNNGKVVCEGCGVETTKPEKSQKGVTPPKTDRQIDHIMPKSKGGQGNADNGQVLCRDCNRQKSNN